MVDTGLNTYISTIAKTALLTISEEVELNEKRKAGDMKARNKLIVSNLRFVVKIASEYSKYGFPIDELISEGNIGLTKAIDKYDSARGKVSTYVSWSIKQRIRRWISNHKQVIRLPVHMSERIRLISLARAEMEDSLGRKPTDKEVAANLKIPEEKVKMADSSKLTINHLEAPVGEDGGTFADVIEDTNAVNPRNGIIAKNRCSSLASGLELLNERERKILIMRFGLNGSEPMNLERVGKFFGLTRERIRQIELKAKHKMREIVGDMDKPKTKEDVRKERLELAKMETLKEFRVC